jgi:dTDP-4-amino-4,6-dideoxygalactose transaminase
MLDLKRQYAPLHEELLAALGRVLETQQFILGAEVAAFEKAGAEQLGVSHALGCSSGTDALWLALAAAGVKSGEAVLTTPFSFFASVSSILRAGATPVLADIDQLQLVLRCGERSARRPSRRGSSRHSSCALVWADRRVALFRADCARPWAHHD